MFRCRWLANRARTQHLLTGRASTRRSVVGRLVRSSSPATQLPIPSRPARSGRDGDDEPFGGPAQWPPVNHNPPGQLQTPRKGPKALRETRGPAGLRLLSTSTTQHPAVLIIASNQSPCHQRALRVHLGRAFWRPSISWLATWAAGSVTAFRLRARGTGLAHAGTSQS